MFSFLSLILLIQSALGSQNILVGIPAAQSGPAGVADHQDWTNGALMAIEEINANGGVLGKQLEAKIIDMDILTPEGGVAAMQTLIEANVHAIASAFTILPQPAMDAAGKQSRDGFEHLCGFSSGEWLFGDVMTQLDISTACYWSFVTQETPEISDGADCTRLDQLVSRLSGLEWFNKTAP